jgi:predicted alpha/beta-fold hydrolase
MGHHNVVCRAAMSEPGPRAPVQGHARIMPTLFPGGHFQTILGGIIPRSYPPGVPKPISMTVTVNEGARLRVDVTHNEKGSPIVLLFHGFTSDANSPVMLRTLGEAFRRGYTVARVNLRNAGGTHALSRGLFTLLQWTDIGPVLDQLSETFPDRRMYAIGFSIGGNFLLNQIARDPRAADMLCAAAAISPPIDVLLSAAQMCLPQNWVYMRRFLKSRIRDIRIKRSLGEEYLDPDAPPLCTVPEFDSRFVLPEVGIKSVAEYYASASSKDVLPQIKVPTMILATTDDPIVPVGMFGDIRDRLSRVRVNIVDRGGHLGFLYWKCGRIECWAAETSLDFFDSLGLEPRARDY